MTNYEFLFFCPPLTGNLHVFFKGAMRRRRVLVPFECEWQELHLHAIIFLGKRLNDTQIGMSQRFKIYCLWLAC
jgi:hypothetical protein